MNIVSLIKEVRRAAEAGNQLANPAVWSHRATVTALLVVVLNALVTIAGGFFDLSSIQIEEADIHNVASGISVIGVLAANVLHVASNQNAGAVPKVKRPRKAKAKNPRDPPDPDKRNTCG